MKLVFLYGPPAVGKFTVAKELAALTGFKLFHNHLTVDVATSIFEHGVVLDALLVATLRQPVLYAICKFRRYSSLTASFSHSTLYE